MSRHLPDRVPQAFHGKNRDCTSGCRNLDGSRPTLQFLVRDETVPGDLVAEILSPGGIDVEIGAAFEIAEMGRLVEVEIQFGRIERLKDDDLMAVGPRPVVGASELPPAGIDDRTVVIVDDVQFTGRTARAAMNELMDWSRPSRILLCVLVDRDGRELPIQPDIVGRHVEVPGPDQSVEVLVPELDGRLGVDLVTTATETA